MATDTIHLPPMSKASRALQRLRDAVTFSYSKLGIFRQRRREVLKQYVGSHYGQPGAAAPQKVPVPLIAIAVRIYMRHLVSRNPKVLIETEYDQLRRMALLLEMDMNHLLKEIDFGTTLEELAIDAMFAAGFYKHGMGDSVIANRDEPAGQPYLDRVSPDDIVWETRAVKFNTAAYVGNRYRIPLEDVKGSPLYENTDGLQPSTRHGSDQDGGLAAEQISRGQDQEDEAEEYLPYIDLWDIYLRRENRLVTFPVDGPLVQLRSKKWTGPEGGPYGMWSFGPVPDQIEALPPVALWIDVHELANRLYRKLGRQADRQKTVTGYSGASANDATRTKDSKDGEMFRMDNPQGIAEMKLGGIDRTNFAFLVDTRNLFSWMAGNLDSLGGLSPQAETLGQEQQLAERSSRTIADLQERAITNTEDAVKALAWYRIYDKDARRRMNIDIGNGVIRIPVMYSAEKFEGDWLDYNLTVRPYSLQYRSPAQKAQIIRSMVQQDVLPMLPFMQAQGLDFDLEEYLRLIARYTDMPELERIVRLVTSSAKQEMGPVGERPTQAANTTRTNVRVNQSTANREGTTRNLMQELLAGDAQSGAGGALSQGGIG